MSNDKKTLADVRPGGRVRLGDLPKDGEVLVEVSGLTGSGKSAIAGEIEILCKALGLDAEWVNGDDEKRLTHADWIGALEMYKPKVVIVEQNIPRAALSAQPSPGGQDALDCIGRIEEAIEFRVPHDIYAAVHGELVELKAALTARQPSKQPDSVALGEATEFCIERGARQPVGEPVAEAIEQLADDVESCVSDACGYLASDSGWDDYGIYRDDAAARYRALPDRIRALAAPPAQAVDLTGLRALSDAWLATAEKAEAIPTPRSAALWACAKELRDWIDSQAVGNG